MVAQDMACHIDSPGALLFVTTAAEVEAGDKQWLQADRDVLVQAGYDVQDYTLTGKSRSEVELALKDIHTLFVSGGNTFYLLQKIQESNCADLIRSRVENGMIYIGSSAGSLVAGPDIYPGYSIDDAEKAPNLKGYAGLNLVDVVVLPHWGNKHFKDPYLNLEMPHVYEHHNNKMVLLNDMQYLRVEELWYRIEDVTRT